MSSKKTSKERRQEESYQNIDYEEAKDVANDLDLDLDCGINDDEKQNQEEHRQMMEGDLQERSMDQI